jgi:hypothetical protein
VEHEGCIVAMLGSSLRDPILEIRTSALAALQPLGPQSFSGLLPIFDAVHGRY